MKKTAFLQALILAGLLTASWILLLNRSKESSSLETTAPAPLPDTAQPPPEEAVDEEQSVKPDQIPPLWKEWVDYLLKQSSAEDRHKAIIALREAVFSMDRTDATARLLELILSRIDLPTGMAFQVGPGGNLSGAPSLQVLLADWLGQIDPVRAASLGQLALNGGGIRLGPDLYVIHLRNYARGTPESGEKMTFIRSQFEGLTEHEPWIGNPTSSIAEAMDVAVYLGDPTLVPGIAGMTLEGNADGLRHASSLALERMIDQAPEAAIRELLASPAGEAMAPAARAGYVARVDPANPEAHALLRDYLAAETTSLEEAIIFLAHFPGMNRSLSYNLLSTNNSNTGYAEPRERLERALDAIHAWAADPRLERLAQPLDEAAARLARQLPGQPSS